MNIDLSKEINDHLQRCRSLAEDAEDSSDNLSQRAAAMTAMNNLLKEITKTQQDVVNMSRIQTMEQVLVELLPEFLTDDQLAELLQEYEKRLTIVAQTDE